MIKPLYRELDKVFNHLIIIIFSLANLIIACSIILLGGKAIVFFGLIFLFSIYALVIVALIILSLLVIPYLFGIKKIESAKFDYSTYTFLAALSSPIFLFASIKTDSSGWVFTFSLIPTVFCIIVNVLNIGYKSRELFLNKRK